MAKIALTKLKITIKRLLGKCVYAGVYIKTSLSKLLNAKNAAPRKHKNNFLNLIASSLKRWRTLSFILVLLIAIYYGLGAFISSKINNSLTKEPPQTAAGHVPAALAFVLKTQVDEQPWTPALPAVFPAAILDNLPNFQLGAKNTVQYFIKKISRRHPDKNLKHAEELLNYPPDIWLFSKTKKDKIAPGSAKQYRKALAKINAYAALPREISASKEELLFYLKTINNVLERQIATLDKHVREHSSDIIDFKADDIFYQAQGTIYATFYLLQALTQDYQALIVANSQYENITSALSMLKQAAALNPLLVKNASPQDLYAANHLLYLAYHLSTAQSRLKSVANQIIINQESLNEN